MVRAGQPDRRAEPDAHRIQANPPRRRERARGPPSDPLGVCLVANAPQPARLVWAGHWFGGGAARRPAPSLRLVAVVQCPSRQRRDEPGQNGPADRLAIPHAGRPAGPRGTGARRVRPHHEERPRGHRPYQAAREASRAVLGGRAAQPVRRCALTSTAEGPARAPLQSQLSLSASPSRAPLLAHGQRGRGRPPEHRLTSKREPRVTPATSSRGPQRWALNGRSVTVYVRAPTRPDSRP